MIEFKISEWIKTKVTEAGCEGIVLGLSGGIDSAVTAVLAKRVFHENTLALILPCDSNPKDKEDAIMVAKKFNISYKVINITATFNSILGLVSDQEKTPDMAKANIKPRLRMTVLYYYANCLNRLVVGTDNRTELTLGYFTKYGDGGIDIAPIGNLVKSEVRELAKRLHIPEQIIKKPPSAGLWVGQEDEKELGVSYREMDNYIKTGMASKHVKTLVDQLQAKNKHKLKMPSIPTF